MTLPLYPWDVMTNEKTELTCRMTSYPINSMSATTQTNVAVNPISSHTVNLVTDLPLYIPGLINNNNSGFPQTSIKILNSPQNPVKHLMDEPPWYLVILENLHYLVNATTKQGSKSRQVSLLSRNKETNKKHYICTLGICKFGDNLDTELHSISGNLVEVEPNKKREAKVSKLRKDNKKCNN